MKFFRTNPTAIVFLSGSVVVVVRKVLLTKGWGVGLSHSYSWVTFISFLMRTFFFFFPYILFPSELAIIIAVLLQGRGNLGKAKEPASSDLGWIERKICFIKWSSIIACPPPSFLPTAFFLRKAQQLNTAKKMIDESSRHKKRFITCSMPKPWWALLRYREGTSCAKWDLVTRRLAFNEPLLFLMFHLKSF